jgi:hypothetical protein
MAKPDWQGLSAKEQAAEIAAVEAVVMERRQRMGIDVAARTTEALNDETAVIRVIDAEESEQKKKNLPMGHKSVSTYLSNSKDRTNLK